MQYTTELLELWWACLTAAMKDRSIAFPISLVIGALAGGLFWWLAAMSARLWNRRFHLKLGLQILSGVAAFLAIILALTFTSSRHMEAAVKIRLNQWKHQIVNNADWRQNVFCDAWMEVAKLGNEPEVREEPNPITDPSIKAMSMGHPESKKAVIRVYVSSAMEQFRKERPYLCGIINPEADIPEDRLNASLISWFQDHPGEPYPAEQAVEVVTVWLEYGAKQQVEPVAAYTKRLSLALFMISQLIVFGTIAFFAYRSNRPALAA